MTIVKPAHVVVVPGAMWGHLRPIVHLSLNLLALYPELHLTFLLAPSSTARVQQELEKLYSHTYTPSSSHSPKPDSDGDATPPKEEKAVADRVQVVTCISEEFDMPAQFSPETFGKEAMDYAQTLPSFLRALFGKEHAIDGTINKFEGVAPNFLIYDLFQAFVPQAARGALSGLDQPMIPLIGFIPSNATATYHHFAPVEKGGVFPHLIQAATEDIAQGMSPPDAYSKHAFEVWGKPKPLPGLPTKFDYPLQHTMPPLGHIIMAISRSAHAVADSDTKGIICPWVAETEMEGVKALEDAIGKKVYMVGPQFPTSMWLGETPEAQVRSADDERVLGFLDKMHKKYGVKRVIYVSLGSLFFPVKRPDLLRFLLESLRDSGYPFICTYASDIVPPPLELIEEIKDLEEACMVRFAPQWDVLQHPATGAFLTHCGSNSTAEACLAGLPLVTMPFAADQGEFAAILTEKYKVGIDLKQVKTFKDPSWTRLYDGTTIVGTEEAIRAEMQDAWTRIRGAEGDEMRERMKGLRDILKKSWAEGKSKDDLAALGTCFQ
ncbi:hypothetical protein I316_02280 [Kwoniella heveanensis BCC8398]|uniref:UDP-glycosyltransferases domain-containing protein n=1 Tax=Kwoniella heveanensis BCC8398 TaxID=1296120 RepID=A0A1B9GXM9_9TREE|nr:hypothetical protein I316_02280 [Kwoniella heveanensis BCC8398]